MLPIQLPANMHGETAEDVPRALVPATHMGYQDGIPGAWLWPDTAPAVKPFGRVNQLLKDHSLFNVSPSLPVALLFK